MTRLAQAATDEQPLSLCDVLEEEYRQLHGPLPPDHPTNGSEAERLQAIYACLHMQQPKALCISGGGIRSATFGLGLLQGLAGCHLLDHFDYLSTVSGGGYLGGWFTAWIHRHPQGAPGVFADLQAAPEPAPIRHLRTYSNYLTPRLGLLSADTGALIAIYLRNLLLHWLLLLPVLMVMLALPRLGVASVQAHSSRWIQYSTLIAGALLACVSLAYIGFNMPTARPARTSLGKFFQTSGDQKGFVRWCLVPLVLAVIALVSYWAWYRQSGGAPHRWLTFALFGTLIHVGSWTPQIIERIATREGKALWTLVPVCLIGFTGGWILWLGTTTIPPLRNPPAAVALYVCFAPFFLLALLILATTLYVGITSFWTTDEDREWWARSSAWQLMLAVGWLLGSTLVIFGPVGLSLLPKTITAVGGLSGIVTLVLGYSGLSPVNTRQPQAAGWQAQFARLVPQALAPLFAAFIVIVLALGTSGLLRGLAIVLPMEVNWHVADPPLLPGIPDGPWAHLKVLHYAPGGFVVAVTLGLLLVALVASVFININKFSLHAMYRNRLIRAYLGASRLQRTPNPFTGFDPEDNIQMHTLRPPQPGAKPPKPMLVTNMALNLVEGQNLAWQQRKADTFTVSPLHCGNMRLGYRRAELYGGHSLWEHPPDSITLGTAMAISGAAASPNMGYHSSPIVTFLMTLFNARLGWWLGNPGIHGNKTFQLRGPKFALEPLLQETFGLTDDTSPYVYLSDGGHFENLGLYEMVLRRCHVIVVSDAGADPTYAFEDLGNAIRKIRIDLGIPITFPPFTIYPPRGQKQGTYSMIGTIQYSAVDGAGTDGRLLYVKPTFYGTEPVDVLQYAQAHTEFPHEATSDQWFSESQFESYRMLGCYIAQTMWPTPNKSATRGNKLCGDDAETVVVKD
jgi:hypothetical protein